MTEGSPGALGRLETLVGAIDSGCTCGSEGGRAITGGGVAVRAKRGRRGGGGMTPGTLPTLAPSARTEGREGREGGGGTVLGVIDRTDTR